MVPVVRYGILWPAPSQNHHNMFKSLTLLILKHNHLYHKNIGELNKQFTQWFSGLMWMRNYHTCQLTVLPKRFYKESCIRRDKVWHVFFTPSFVMLSLLCCSSRLWICFFSSLCFCLCLDNSCLFSIPPRSCCCCNCASKREQLSSTSCFVCRNSSNSVWRLIRMKHRNFFLMLPFSSNSLASSYCISSSRLAAVGKWGKRSIWR